MKQAFTIPNTLLWQRRHGNSCAPHPLQFSPISQHLSFKLLAQFHFYGTRTHLRCFIFPQMNATYRLGGKSATKETAYLSRRRDWRWHGRRGSDRREWRRIGFPRWWAKEENIWVSINEGTDLLQDKGAPMDDDEAADAAVGMKLWSSLWPSPSLMGIPVKGILKHNKSTRPLGFCFGFFFFLQIMSTTYESNF